MKTHIQYPTKNTQIKLYLTIWSTISNQTQISDCKFKKKEKKITYNQKYRKNKTNHKLNNQINSNQSNNILNKKNQKNNHSKSYNQYPNPIHQKGRILSKAIVLSALLIKLTPYSSIVDIPPAINVLKF